MKATALITNELGMVGKQRQIPGIKDPRLLRLAFAVFEQQKAGTPDHLLTERLAEEYEEPPALIQRLVLLYSPNGTAKSRWWKTRLSWTPLPAMACPWCGHPAVRHPLIAEIDVGVCPDCRKDHSGVMWGTEYDEYLVLQTANGPRTLTGALPVWGKRRLDAYDPWPR